MISTSGNHGIAKGHRLGLTAMPCTDRKLLVLGLRNIGKPGISFESRCFLTDPNPLPGGCDGVN